MQTDVKVFTPELLVAIFPNLTVQFKKQPFHYNLHVDVLNGDDLIKLVEIYLECAVDLFIYRYNKGLTIKITPHPEGYNKPRVLKLTPLEVA